MPTPFARSAAGAALPVMAHLYARLADMETRQA